MRERDVRVRESEPARGYFWALVFSSALPFPVGIIVTVWLLR